MVTFCPFPTVTVWEEDATVSVYVSVSVYLEKISTPAMDDPESLEDLFSVCRSPAPDRISLLLLFIILGKDLARVNELSRTKGPDSRFSNICKASMKKGFEVSAGSSDEIVTPVGIV